MKDTIKKLIPPIVLDWIQPSQTYGFFGQYRDWDSAKHDSLGYDNPAILEKVKTALLKVKTGQVAHERDSVVFDKKQYSWATLTFLLLNASRNDNNLRVLDFGGSLGSSYFQNRDFLSHISLVWDIIEQENFVDCGKKYFEDEELHFYTDLNSVLQKKHTVGLFGSSLQYVSSPYNILEKVLGAGIQTIILERTPFFEKNIDEVIKVQKVPPKVYDASYPAWIFNFDKMKTFFETHGYRLVATTEDGTMPAPKSKSDVALKSLYLELISK